MFADVFVFHSANPYYLPIGRLDGITLYMTSGHPALNYEVIRYAGIFVGQLVDYLQLSDLTLTILLRFVFSCFEYLSWLALFFVLWRSGKKTDLSVLKNRYWQVGVLLIAIWPASLLNSTNLNMDSSVGVLLCGFLCATIIAFARLATSKMSFVAVLFGAFCFGFGKNEWNLVLWGSIILSLGYVGLFCVLRLGERASAPKAVLFLVCLITGSTLGNYYNYWFDPAKYMEGFSIMRGVGEQKSLLSTGDFFAWGKMTLERMSFNLVHILLWLNAARLLWRQRSRPDFYAWFLFVFSSGLFFGYFITYSEVGSRYFAPSLVALISLNSYLFSQFQFSAVGLKRIRWILILFAVHSSVLIGSTLYQIYQHPDVVQSRFELPVEVKTAGCIPILEQSDVYNRTDIDYVSYTGMEEIVRAKGKTICKQNYTNIRK